MAGSEKLQSSWPAAGHSRELPVLAAAAVGSTGLNSALLESSSAQVWSGGSSAAADVVSGGLQEIGVVKDSEDVPSDSEEDMPLTEKEMHAREARRKQRRACLVQSLSAGDLRVLRTTQLDVQAFLWD